MAFPDHRLMIVHRAEQAVHYRYDPGHWMVLEKGAPARVRPGSAPFPATSSVTDYARPSSMKLIWDS